MAFIPMVATSLVLVRALSRNLTLPTPTSRHQQHRQSAM